MNYHYKVMLLYCLACKSHEIVFSCIGLLMKIKMIIQVRSNLVQKTSWTFRTKSEPFSKRSETVFERSVLTGYIELTSSAVSFSKSWIKVCPVRLTCAWHNCVMIWIFWEICGYATFVCPPMLTGGEDVAYRYKSTTFE